MKYSLKHYVLNYERRERHRREAEIELSGKSYSDLCAIRDADEKASYIDRSEALFSGLSFIAWFGLNSSPLASGGTFVYGFLGWMGASFMNSVRLGLKKERLEERVEVATDLIGAIPSN